MDKNRNLKLNDKENFNDSQEKLYFYLSSIKEKKEKEFSNFQLFISSIIIVLTIFTLIYLIYGVDLILLLVLIGFSLLLIYFDKEDRNTDSSNF